MPDDSAAQVFTLKPEHYDALIDWPKRLERESPFFRSTLAQANARTVLELACGTGHHARMYASWDLDVTATDSSEAMIADCRRQNASDNLRYRVEDLQQLAEHDETYDAVICIGNSIALLPTMSDVIRAAQTAAKHVSSNGVLILHVWNLWQLDDGQLLWQKCKRLDENTMILKGIHRAGQRGYVDIVVADPTSNAGAAATESFPFHGIEAETITTAIQRAGLDKVECFGNYNRSPYDRHTSTDLIVTATKSEHDQ